MWRSFRTGGGALPRVRQRDFSATLGVVSADARLHPRLSLHARADVIGDEVVLGHSVADISLGGCRFEGSAWESAGVEVELVVTFPGLGANLPLRGVVVRSSPHDMGVKFHDLSDDQRWALRKYLREANKQLSA